MTPDVNSPDDGPFKERFEVEIPAETTDYQAPLSAYVGIPAAKEPEVSESLPVVPATDDEVKGKVAAETTKRARKPKESR